MEGAASFFPNTGILVLLYFVPYRGGTYDMRNL